MGRIEELRSPRDIDPRFGRLHRTWAEEKYDTYQVNPAKLKEEQTMLNNQIAEYLKEFNELLGQGGISALEKRIKLYEILEKIDDSMELSLNFLDLIIDQNINNENLVREIKNKKAELESKRNILDLEDISDDKKIVLAKSSLEEMSKLRGFVGKKMAEFKNNEESKDLSPEEIDEIKKELHVGEDGMWKSLNENATSYKVVDFDLNEMKVLAKEQGGKNTFLWSLDEWRERMNRYSYEFKAGEVVEVKEPKSEGSEQEQLEKEGKKSGEERKVEFEKKYGVEVNYIKEVSYFNKKKNKKVEYTNIIYIAGFKAGITSDEDEVIVMENNQGSSGKKINLLLIDFENNYIKKGFKKEVIKKGDMIPDEVIERKCNVAGNGVWTPKNPNKPFFVVDHFEKTGDNEIITTLFLKFDNSDKFVEVEYNEFIKNYVDNGTYLFEEKDVEDLQSELLDLQGKYFELLSSDDFEENEEDLENMNKRIEEIKKVLKLRDKEYDIFKLKKFFTEKKKNIWIEEFNKIMSEIEDDKKSVSSGIELREFQGENVSDLRKGLGEIELKIEELNKIKNSSKFKNEDFDEINKLGSQIKDKLNELIVVLEEKNSVGAEISESDFDIRQQNEEEIREAELQRVRDQIQNGDVGRQESESESASERQLGEKIVDFFGRINPSNLARLENVETENPGFVRGILGKIRKNLKKSVNGFFIGDRVEMHYQNVLASYHKDKINVLQSQIVGYKETLKNNEDTIRELQTHKEELIRQGIYGGGIEKKVAKLEEEGRKIENKIEKANNKILKQQSEVATYVTERNYLANKVIESYESKLKPLELDFEKLKDQRNQMELAISLYEVQTKHLKNRIDKLEKLKLKNKSLGISNKLVNEQIKEIREIRDSLLLKCATDRMNLNFEIGQLKNKMDACRLRINEVKHAVNVGPSSVEIESEEVDEPVVVGTEFDLLRAQTGNYENITSEISSESDDFSQEQEREGTTIEYYVDKLNEYAQDSRNVTLKKALESSKLEFMNLPQVRRISGIQMEFDDFNKIIKNYLLCKNFKLSVNDFNNMMTSFKQYVEDNKNR